MKRRDFLVRSAGVAGGLAWAVGRAAAPLRVYTVNYPLSYFAERIAGVHAEVRFPAPADVDPAFWLPSVETVMAYQRADVILLNGAGYANWVERVSLPRSRMVNSSRGFRDRYIEVSSGLTHQHGASGEHAHVGTAFTTWLDLHQAAQQASAIRDTLVKLQPQSAEELSSSFRVLEKELATLDEQLMSLSQSTVIPPLLGSHPVYQYLARRYRLDIDSRHWEPEEMPAEEEWRSLVSALASRPAPIMLWEGEPLSEIRARLESLGVASVVFDTCANVPDRGDFMTVMAANAARLQEALGRLNDRR